ncbi:VOC family protein [Affinibrenneria salicis]|uniref:VOC family protein n=1 Tax=Affinibrenneria salicis TaxID=2590031 RepID=A0A5J5FQD9_9GAMM|nr:VOC family protein [Affinibrenneria salicis]KAA8995234.1 VOC family protein [Affinibrenneria salicis]
MEIDHVFICSGDNARYADLLVQSGFREGSANVHPGQGTANRRFFFDNAFIELIYADGAQQGQENAQDRTHILRRIACDDGSLSPFGVGLRPSAPTEKTPAFPYDVYQPDYLPAGLEVDIGIAPLSEPLWFFMNFSGRPDRFAPDKRQPLNHPCGARQLTSLALTMRGPAEPSAPARRLQQDGVLSLASGAEHVMRLTFDHQRQRQQQDFRPYLPLVIAW